MYKAGDVVVNRRGDVVTLISGDMDCFPVKYLLGKVYFLCEDDGRCYEAEETEYDIVGYAKMTPKNDDIKTPQHYHRLSPEPLVVLEQWNLGNCYSNAVKYICRAGHKEDAIKDLRKAIEYLERKIEMIENNKNV